MYEDEILLQGFNTHRGLRESRYVAVVSTDLLSTGLLAVYLTQLSPRARRVLVSAFVEKDSVQRMKEFSYVRLLCVCRLDNSSSLNEIILERLSE